MKNTNYETRIKTEDNMPSSTQIDSLLSPQQHLPSLMLLADNKESKDNTINVGNGIKSDANKNISSSSQQGISWTCNIFRSTIENLVILTSKNYTNSVFDHLGFLEKCATLFIDGNYKQTNTHLEHSNSNINPKQVKQTFAQEIEEKYFQIPSSSNVQEIKPSRRGSLRGGFQVCIKWKWL